MASSSIYNHKHLQPAGASSQGGPSQQPPYNHAKLNDCFDVIRTEFDILAQEMGGLRTQRDDFDSKLTHQVNELTIIRQSLYELETQHTKIRAQYEEEIRSLRHEVQTLRTQQNGPPPPREGIASLGRDRDIRERERELAARGDAAGRDALGIGRPIALQSQSVPSQGPQEPLGALALASHAGPIGLGVGAGPPSAGTSNATYPDPFYGRPERERQIDRERERELRDRERDRDRDRDRDREIRERERERDRLERERDRERDGREVKRIKTEGRKMDRQDPYSPSLNPLQAHTPLAHPQLQMMANHAAQQPGPPGSITLGPAPPTPSNAMITSPTLPNGNVAANPNGAAAQGGPSALPTPKLPPAIGPPYPPSTPAGPSQGAPPNPITTPNQPPTPSLQAHTPAPSATNGNGNAPPSPSGTPPPDDPYAGGGQNTPMLDLMDVHNVPPELKKEGSDWFAVFNGNPTGDAKDGSVVKRSLDVNLVHTLMHESVVCCVRFSADGKFLATGCNRTAQIYDTKTGAKTCVLVDEDASKTGDLYIRSVCFSPDGKFLATGAEDKQIRIWDIAKRRIRNIFDGHQQEIYSLDFSRDGRLIVSGSGDRTARIWDMNDRTTSKILTINEPDSIDAGVTSVCISPDGRLVAAGSLDTVVRIWDVQTGSLLERLKGHKDSVYSVAFTPDGKGLVSGSLDKTLKYWDVRPIMRRLEGGGAGPLVRNGSVGPGGSNGTKEGGDKNSPCTMNFNGHKDYVLSVAVSHDGQWVVSGSKDRCVQFWDAKSAKVQCVLQGHKNSVISIDLSPAGSILATGSGDWQARIWSYNAM